MLINNMLFQRTIMQFWALEFRMINVTLLAFKDLEISLEIS